MMDDMLKKFYDLYLKPSDNEPFEKLPREIIHSMRISHAFKVFEAQCASSPFWENYHKYVASLVHQEGTKERQDLAKPVKSLEELVEEARDQLPYTGDCDHEWYHIPIHSPSVKPYYNPYELFPVRAVSPIILRFRKQRVKGIVTGWEFVEATQAISRY